MRGRILVLWLVVATAIGCSDPTTSQSLPSSFGAGPSKDERQLEAYLALAARSQVKIDLFRECMELPDIPGNAWPSGSARALCTQLIEPELPLARIATTLSQQSGAASLDKHFSALQNDKAGTDGLFRAYWVFDESEDARRIAERWLALSRDSAFAKAAVAKSYMSAGFDARGSKFIQDTSALQIAGMRKHFAKAAEFYGQAFAENPRLSPACVGLMAIGRARADVALLTRATMACNQADGDSWFVLGERAVAAEEKWGGTAEMRQRVVDDARERVIRNPALAYFTANIEAEEPDALSVQGRWREAAPGLERAALVSPNARWLGYTGVAAHKAGQEEKAIRYLSQALRFWPKHTWFREMRAAAKVKSGDPQGARSDLESVAVTGDASGFAYSLLGPLLLDAGKLSEAKGAFQRAMRSPDQRLWAFHKWCEVVITRESDVDAAMECSEALVNEYPKDSYALFMRAWVLNENKRDGADESAQRFFAQANPADSHDADLVRQLRELRGDK